MSRRITIGVLAVAGAGTLLSAQSLRLSEGNSASVSSITWGDYDGDGLEDAFVVSPGARARLLRNSGDGTLQDVTKETGLPTALHARFALFEDVDRDGDRDLLLGELEGASRLFQNSGDTTFVETTEASGILHEGEDIDAGFFDFDRDGLPDLELRTTGRELLFHNLGAGSFEAVDLGLAGGLTAGAPIGSTSLAPTSAPSSSTSARPTSSGAPPTPSPSATLREVEVPRDLNLAGRTGSFLPTPGSTDAIAFPACALALKDQDGTGCLHANRIPALGMLYPLSTNLFVDAATGNVGVGTTSPTRDLDVQGSAAIRSGGLEIFNDASVEVIELNDLLNDGLILIRNQAGSNRIALDGGSSDLGGDVAVLAADGSSTLFFDGESTNSGGEVSIRSDVPEETVELLGDEADDSGQITLFDTNGANTRSAIVLDARDSTGSGGEIQVLGPSGNVAIDLDGGNGSVAQFELFEDDGSSAMEFFMNDLDLKNGLGTSTINFDRILGTKSAVVDTQSYGRRLLYTMESPEVWFEDFGSARLENGTAVVELDPMFLETVTVDEANPLKVFVTPRGSTGGLWVEANAGHFIVHENWGGTSNVAFDWRVVAKRRGLENRRLDLLVETEGETAEQRALPPR